MLSCCGLAPPWRRRSHLLARFQALAFLIEPVTGLGQGACDLVQSGLPSAGLLQRLQMRGIQTTAGRRDFLGILHPVRQFRQGR